MDPLAAYARRSIARYLNLFIRCYYNSCNCLSLAEPLLPLLEDIIQFDYLASPRAPWQCFPSARRLTLNGIPSVCHSETMLSELARNELYRAVEKL